MTTVITKMYVPDYERWAQQFEAGAESRKAFGIVILAHGHDASDANIAIVIAQMEADKVREINENPILQENLRKEGIKQLELTVIEG